MRRRTLTSLSAILIASCAVSSTPEQSLAQQQAPYVYPAEGQSPDQQAQDEYECYQWARGQTGYDPTQPQAAPQTDGGGSVGGSAVKGAALGAVGGVLVGGLFGRPGRGAAIGAGSGAVIGGVSKSRRQEQQRQEQQAAQQQQQAATQEYYRAFSGCMGGRGYTIS